MSINSVVNDTVTGESVVNALKPKPPAISGYTVSGVDDTALDPAGGQTILLNGTGFQRGATVTLNGTAISVVTYVNANQLSFTSPAVSAGTYTIYAVNADGGTGIYIPGLIYSNLPTWTTGAGSLGSYYETQTIASNVVASGDAPVTYSLFSGALPTGAVFNANGTISGSAPVDGGSTTYSFTVQATDAQLQDSTRSFSLTINTDVVSWTTPNASATYTPTVNSVMANIGLTATSAAGSAVSYSANSLPTGVSLSGNTISGTPSATGSSSTLLTATATATSRSATRTINWTIAVASDSYFGYNTLLLPGASTTFVKDASSNNFAVTIAGDTKPNSFNPYTPGYYSNQFTAQGQYLTFGTSSTLALGEGSFTVELWLHLNAYNASTSTLIDWRTAGNAGLNAPSWSIGANGILDVYLNISSGIAVSASSAIPLNTWTHIACVRNGTALTLYFNGVSVGTGTSAVNCSIETFRINDTQGSYYTNCSISNLRIVKGTAVYTSAFTPSTGPLTAITNTVLLTCQSNRFIDNSSNNFTVTVGGSPQIKSFDPFTPNTSYSTYGSGYFDGTGDYLSVSNANLALNTGDFTLECWINADTGLSDKGIFEGRTSGSGTTGFTLTAITPTTIRIWSGSALITSGTISYVKTWCHVAVVRLSGTTTLYINGVSQGTTTSLGNLTDSSFVVGAGRYAGPPNVDAFFTGYISDFRIVKGTAVYTTNFTPPSVPLTAIANTQLLTLQNNQSTNNSVFLDSSTNNFLVTRNGNATQGSFSPYGGNWSNYFGSANYISAPSNAAFGFGTGDFTVEAWVFPNAAYTTYNYIYTTGVTNGLVFYVLGGVLYVRQYGASDLLASSTAPALNTWTHVAATRSGTTLRIFVNGVQTGTTTNSTNFATGSGFVGNDGTNAAPWFGYISNMRVVKGTAVYTSAFTPSTTPLTAISGTSLLTCQSNRLIDNSINNFAITRNGDVGVQRFSPFGPVALPTSTSYSAYFDGSGDYVNAPQNAGFALGTGDFTIECWVYYIPGGSGDRFIVDNGNGNFLLRYASGTTLQFYAQSNQRLAYAVTLANAWYHLAVVHSGTTYTLYVNGVAVNTSTGSDNITNSSAIGIGAISSGGGDYFSGYISNVRIVKGVAVYTGAFTVPTGPLTATQSSGTNIAAITGTATSLLTCQSSTFIDNSTNNFAITGGGDSRSATQNPFGYTSATADGYTPSTIGGSGYFDGSGDYITVPNDTNINLGSSDFTIEMWVYLTSSAGNFTLFQKPSSYELKVDSSRWVWQINANNNIFVANGTLANNTWTHVAMVRNGATSTLYVNGAAYASGGSADASSNGNALIVGSGSAAFGGYISDFRIIKGTAVYKSNFLPPAAPLTAIQNTVLLTNMTSAGVYDAAMQNNMETVGDARLSTAVTKFGGSSMAFDGTGDRLLSASSPVNIMGGGDFTIEFWLYPNNTSSAYRALVSSENYPATTGGWSLYQNGTAIEFWLTPGASVTINATSAITASTWQHLALCRASGTLRLFVNGTSVASVSNSTSLTGQQIWIGDNNSNGGGSYVYNGYIDDLRITRGYARYTANFTPPTEAFMTK